ncbi:MAG: ATP synthase subunit I [Gallionella sp.]
MLGVSEFAYEKHQGSRIVVVQIAVAFFTALAVFIFSQSWLIAVASFWGAITAALNAWLMLRGLLRIEKKTNYKPQSVLRSVYRNSAERFIFVTFSLFLAMGGLKLSAAVVLCGFIVGQTVLIMARLLMNKR